MKFLFLNPPIESGEIYMKELGRCGRKSVAGELWPQTGLAYLAAMMLKEQADAKIIDAIAESMSVDDVIKEIADFSPDVVIIGTTTPTFNNDCTVSKKIKKSFDNILIGFTGTHVSVLPEETLTKSEADFLILNEGEETVREIALSDLSDLNNLSNIKGIAYKSDGEIKFTPKRDFVENLDDLPFPARNLLPNDKYKMPFFENEPFVTIIPTRGCPFQCIFCRAGGVWGTKVRTRSVENVCNEIKDIIKNLGIRNVVFMTDSLTLKREWTSRLCEKILNENIKFKWICNSRVDAVDLETLKLMKKAGCTVVSYGIESGNQEILDRSKKAITIDQARNAIKFTKEAGLISMAYFIIGLPGETKETIKQSIAFAKEIKPDYVNFHVATPFPGTEFYQMAKDNGWLISNDWSDYEEEGSAVINLDTLSAEELVKAQRYAMRQFYLRPSRILQEIKSIKSLEQLKSRLKAGLKVISSIFEK